MTSILDILPTTNKTPVQVAKAPVKMVKKAPTFANQAEANATSVSSETPAKATKVEGTLKKQVKAGEAAGREGVADEVGGGRSLVEQLVELRRERDRLLEERSREQVRWGGGDTRDSRVERGEWGRHWRRPRGGWRGPEGTGAGGAGSPRPPGSS